MVNWKSHGEVLNVDAFSWVLRDAWASEVEERNGKFYFYISAEHKTKPGKAIGVAVADNPEGHFRDALGHALITNDMTNKSESSFDDIDPTVFVDDDGQAYLYWGNNTCYYVKLKENMIEIDGEIHTVDLPRFTEAPFLHKNKNTYYLSYAYGWSESIAYATSNSLEGSLTFQKIINRPVNNCRTNHQSIIEFKGQSYFIYHTGDIGGEYRRSVAVDYLFYNEDGSIKEIVPTATSVGPAINAHAGSYLGRNSQVNNKEWTEHRELSLLEGDKIIFKPQTSDEGTWSWSGAGGIRGNQSRLHIKKLKEDMTGNLVALFTNNKGKATFLDFNLIVYPQIPKGLKSGAMYVIQPANSDYAVTFEETASNSEARITLDELSYDTNKLWRLKLDDDVFWSISPSTELSEGFDVRDGLKNDGADVLLWSYWGGTNQQWYFKKLKNGYYQIKARHSQKCLTYDRANNRLIQSADTGNMNQLFKLIEVK